MLIFANHDDERALKWLSYLLVRGCPSKVVADGVKLELPYLAEGVTVVLYSTRQGAFVNTHYRILRKKDVEKRNFVTPSWTSAHEPADAIEGAPVLYVALREWGDKTPKGKVASFAMSRLADDLEKLKKLFKVARQAQISARTQGRMPDDVAQMLGGKPYFGANLN
jgi:hypothetical protein